MAAYGSGYYGGGNYSFGVSLGEAAILSASSASIAATRVCIGDVAVSASSSASASGQRIAFISCTVASDALMEIDSNVIVNQPIAIQASSAVSINGKRVRLFNLSINCVSAMYASGRLKWNNQGDTPEVWLGIPDTSETWTPIADVAEVWETV